MKISTCLALSGAAIALLCITPTANAASVAKPSPPNVLIYSAQTVATNGNNVVIPLSVFNFVLDAQAGGTTDTVTILAPPGTSFTTTGTIFFSCSPKVTGGNATSSFAQAGIVGGNIVTTVPFGAGACQGGDEVSLISSPAVGVTLQTATDLAVPGREVTIFAQYASPTSPFFADSAPFPLVTLRAGNSVAFDAHASVPPLAIDLTGANASVAGTQFSNGVGGINPTGFLGTFTLAENQQINAATGGPLATPLVLNGGSVNINGNFLSISQAYLVLNGNRASCVGPAPAGAPTGTVTNNNQISFTIGAAAGNINVPATFPSSRSWAVCIVSGVTAGGAPVQIPVTNTTIAAQVLVTGVANAFTLTADNQPFGSIIANGSVAYFQNVFGQANGYPTFFRVANPSSNPAAVTAILTRDGIAQQFTGQLTAVPADNAMFFSADTVAGAVGTTLVAGSQHATVRLLSPTANVLFSAVSQNAFTGTISALP
jgi:hypothetical protein